MVDEPTAPGIEQINLGELEAGDFPVAEDWESFRVHVAPEVHRVMVRHAKESASKELCGVLVGEPKRDAKGPFLLISASIRGEHSENQAAQVTFTQETWAHIHQEMDAKYPGSKMVGWYHTHPGFGIFLSPMDVFIHENFFDLPWQIAFVLDPRSGDEGFFCWKAGKVDRMRHYWIGDKEIAYFPKATAASGDVGEKVRRLEDRIDVLAGMHRKSFTGLRLWIAFSLVISVLALCLALVAERKEIRSLVLSAFHTTRKEALDETPSPSPESGLEPISRETEASSGSTSQPKESEK